MEPTQSAFVQEKSTKLEKLEIRQRNTILYKEHGHFRNRVAHVPSFIIASVLGGYATEKVLSTVYRGAT